MEYPGLAKQKRFQNHEKGAKNIVTDISEIGVPTPPYKVMLQYFTLGVI